MELYLQFGYGMMAHTRHLIDVWGEGTVILSPRDMNDDQLRALSVSVNKLGGSVLLDPQFYLPHADHARLTSHEYWPAEYATGSFWLSEQLERLVETLGELNKQLNTSVFILPGLYADRIDEDWLTVNQMVLDEAQGQQWVPEKLCATVCLSAEAVCNEEQAATLIEAGSQWDCKSIYLVCEHPKGEYLVSDPSWVSGVLDIVAGFRLAAKEVILGYCNHQMLVTGLAGVNAIASGTWMNVRSFPPEKFRVSYEEEIKKRSIWYYAPDCLSEYTIPYLDIARKQGVLELMFPGHGDVSYVQQLFSGAQPTTIEFTEQDAFRHYLNSLRLQAASLDTDSFDAAVTSHQTMVAESKSRIDTLRSFGVVGKGRDFVDCIDANLSAASVLASSRGALLRRKWGSLTN